MSQKRRKSDLSLQLFLLAMFGLALRVVCAEGELWLDEIWSQSIIRPLAGPLQIFTLYTDNNHPLNSLWLWYAGEGSLTFTVRALSLLASALFLWDLRRAWRDGIIPAATVIFLVVAYPLVLYGSEARGYMPMLLGLWICWRTVAKSFMAEGWLSIKGCIFLTFGASIGVLSHGTFLYWFPALCAWAVIGSRNFRFENLLSVIPGLAACTAGYLFFFRLISAGTGPLKPNVQVVLDTLSVIAGGPELTEFSTAADMWAVIGGAIVVIIVLIEIAMLFQEGKREWIFFLLAIVICPAVSLTIQSPRVLFIRYFLPSIFTAYLLLGGFCARLYARDLGGKVVSTLLCLAFVGCNLYQVLRLVSLGRGDGRGLVASLLYSQPTGEIVISGDNIFRDRLVLRHFSDEVGDGNRIVYKDERSAPWRIISSQDQFFKPSPSLEDGRYVLAGTYPSANLSGWNWYLYRFRKR